jgi:hypothetical protein
MQYINMYKIDSYDPKLFQDEIQQISAENHLFLQMFLQYL